MAALTIMIIRHAEKPDPKFPKWGAGVDIMGNQGRNSLAVLGWQRAGAWAALFACGAFGPDYPKPDVVYAANPDIPAPDKHEASRRPFETITPLCKRLSIKANKTFAVGQETGLVADVTKLTGVVLIAWEHKKIGESMLPLLAKGQVIPYMPAKWPNDRFDVVLRFDRPNKDAQWRFRQLFPRLLAGDSDVPL
jgi:hypothetical protein